MKSLISKNISELEEDLDDNLMSIKRDLLKRFQIFVSLFDLSSFNLKTQDADKLDLTTTSLTATETDTSNKSIIEEFQRKLKTLEIEYEDVSLNYQHIYF